MKHCSKLWILVALWLSFASVIFAQQTATTKDGRTVILKPDGTWEFAKAEAKQESVLLIETGVVFKSGDVKPLARRPFYLVKVGPEDVLKQTGLPLEGDKGLLSLASMLGASLDLGKAPENPPTDADKLRAAIKPSIVVTMETDFVGKGTFPPVPPGKYYVLN